jgi:hypothetical protein
MQFRFNDGGAFAAGYKRQKTYDCVARAIAIAAELTYQEVCDAIDKEAERERPRCGRKRSSAQTGVLRRTYERVLMRLGWKWVPTMRIGSGCKVHLRAEELPRGRLIARVSRHLVAVIDGVIHDRFDCSRDGTRCVYGYWVKE